jgi:hypothetical protein
MLQTQRKTRVGFQKFDKSFILAFPSKHHAVIANKHISPLTLFDIDPKQSIISSCHNVDLIVHKNTNLQTDICTIEEIDVASLFSFPIINNVGLVVGIELTVDQPSKLIYDSFVIDPFDDQRHFRPPSF